MNLVNSPDIPIILDRPALMLCGGISGCDNWQSEFVDMLRAEYGSVVNPRREVWDEQYTTDQYAWEWNMSRLVDAMVFWFPADVSEMSISLMALGTHLARPVKLFVGYGSGYVHADAVDTFISRARSDVAIQIGLDSLKSEVLDFVKTAEIKASVAETVERGERNRVADELRHFADRIDEANKMDRVPSLISWMR
jgi:hypothetical protein